MREFLNWLETLPSGAGSFLGTLAGSSIGLIAILIGALLNAHLNRKRDDRLRNDDRHSVASALKAELANLKETLEGNAKELESGKRTSGGFVVPDPAHSIQVLPHLLPKIGLLDADTVATVTTAYLLVSQYSEGLILLGGKLIDMPGDRRVVMMPSSEAAGLARINRVRAKAIADGISKLDGHISTGKRRRRWW